MTVVLSYILKSASFCLGSLSGVFFFHFYMHFRGFLKSVWRMSWALWFGLRWICKLLLAGWSFPQYWFYQPANVGGRPFHLLCLLHLTFLLHRSLASSIGLSLSFALLCHCFEAIVDGNVSLIFSGLRRWYREQRWISVSWFLCPATLLKLLITSWNVPVWFWGSLLSNGIPFAHRGSWASFSINAPVISFSWLCSRQGAKHHTKKEQMQWTALSCP